MLLTICKPSGSEGTSPKKIVRTYNGFVFLHRRRAFLIGAHKAGHVKEMILSLPGLESDEPHSSTIRGLVLTVSTDEREPFAARLLLQK